MAKQHVRRNGSSRARGKGRVRGDYSHGWSARFQFKDGGIRKSYDGPVRDLWAGAETDRQRVQEILQRTDPKEREHTKNVTWLRFLGCRIPIRA